MKVEPFKIRDRRDQPAAESFADGGSYRRLFSPFDKRRGGVGLSVSEFISVEGLRAAIQNQNGKMRFMRDERPFAAQIFGGSAGTNAHGGRDGGRSWVRISSTSTAVARRRKS